MTTQTSAGLPPGIGPAISSPWLSGLSLDRTATLSQAITDLSGITARIRMAVPQVITLNVSTPTFQSAPIAVAPLTAELSVILRRPTTLVPQNWDSASSLRVTLVYTVDGQEYRCVGQVTGGIRTKMSGAEADEYKLIYRPPTLKVAGVWRRVGELSTTRTAHVIVEWLIGSIETTLLVAESAEAPAPVE